MIEVEKKYLLNAEQEKKLIEGATFLEEKTNEDVYYDTKELALTTSDNWLRSRNGRFELKRRLHKLGHSLGATAYEEMEDDEQIREFLKLPGSNSLEVDLLSAGYTPFVSIIKQRRSYRRGEFMIDLDICDFGYQIAEIELMIDDDAMRSEALAKINTLADEMNLDTTRVHGKIIEYLYRYNKPHYKALEDAGVL
ncbi:CYTH domain-containing protein [Candidatus Uhrbacteria bacterium]|jgi:adenylate cyclase class IV|nr:CYTH domain-containing protein [Candidatus Uhrbacteria bacterium]